MSLFSVLYNFVWRRLELRYRNFFDGSTSASRARSPSFNSVVDLVLQVQLEVHVSSELINEHFQGTAFVNVEFDAGVSLLSVGSHITTYRVAVGSSEGIDSLPVNSSCTEIFLSLLSSLGPKDMPLRPWLGLALRSREQSHAQGGNSRGSDLLHSGSRTHSTSRGE